MRPSISNDGTVTTLTLSAPLHLSTSSNMQVIVYKSKHDIIRVLKAATLSGRMTAFTGTGFSPAYLTTISGVMTFPSYSGKFTSYSWGGTPVGLGWKPRPIVTVKDSHGHVTGYRVDEQLVDVAPPALGIASIPAFTEFSSQRVTYYAVDNRTGVSSFDVRWRTGSSRQAFGSWHYPSTWQHTTATSETLTGLVTGYTYCFSIRARDNAGNVTPWSVPLCTTKMYDDTALTASGWSRYSHRSGFYYQTYTQSATYGRTLRRYGTYERIGLIAYRCPTCGTIQIWSGNTLIKQLSLVSTSSRTGLFSYVTALRPQRTGYVTLKIVSHAKRVLVDAFGLQR
jgi:hypothetical protein